MIIGPSAVFGNSNDPHANDPELKSPALYRLLMSDEVNGDLARSLMPRPEIVKQVPFFMRPELYEEPFFYEKCWDVYFHIKTGGNKWARAGFDSLTATFHGWYDFKELKYKAQHSAVCVHSCHYDNYGLAVHEISMLGCPLIYDKNGMKRGSIGPGMGIEVSDTNTESQEHAKEIIDAASRIESMDRKKFWEASMEYQSIANCKRRYREALGI
jgi:glycosyltransferase involved in cell wall biosynthesis